MMQLDLLSSPPAQRHSETSVAAAEAINPHVPRLEQMVLDLLRERGPMTDKEMQAALRMKGDTQRPRRINLEKWGLVEPTGEKRNNCGLYRAVPDK